MFKNNDINSLFSLLDKKPEGDYKEVLLDEKTKESKARWPIFELSDTTKKTINPDYSYTPTINNLKSDSKVSNKKEGAKSLQNLFFKLEKKEEKQISIEKSIFDKLVRK